MAIKENTVCDNVKWIDITEPTSTEIETISKDYNLHYQLVRDCMEPDHLPKYDSIDDVNFLILRYYCHGFDKQMATIQELSNLRIHHYQFYSGLFKPPSHKK